MTTHDNSILSNRSLSRYTENQKIMEAYRVGNLTDRQASDATDIFIVNARRAITGLIAEGHLKEINRIKCPSTKRWVRVCGFVKSTHNPNVEQEKRKNYRKDLFG